MQYSTPKRDMHINMVWCSISAQSIIIQILRNQYRYLFRYHIQELVYAF